MAKPPSKKSTRTKKSAARRVQVEEIPYATNDNTKRKMHDGASHSKSRGPKNTGFFTEFSKKVACWTGSPTAFIAALAVIIVWGVSGPIFGFSDTWQLVINTGTTIVTFLMVFLIQNTQNRDTKALQLKLDELIRATQGAHTVLLDLEELSEEELDSIRNKYEEIARLSREKLRNGGTDTDIPDVVLEQNPLQ